MEYKDWLNTLYAEAPGSAQQPKLFTSTQIGSLSPDSPEFQDKKFNSLNPMGWLLDVITLPGDIVRSGVKEGIDLFAGRPATPQDFAQQVSEGIGTGDILADYGVLQDGGWWSPERWAGRTLGLIGDVALDPISYVGGPGVASLSRGGGRALAAGAGARRHAIQLDYAARKGDTLASGFQNTLRKANKKFDDANAAHLNAPADDSLRLARQQALKEKDEVLRQVDTHLDDTGVTAAFDDALGKLGEHGGGVAAITDDTMIAAILGTEKVAGLRLRPNFIPGRRGEEGGLQILNAKQYAALTKPARALRGAITGTKWWAKAPLRRSSSRKLLEYARQSVHNAPAGTIAARWALINHHDTAIKQVRQLVGRYESQITQIERAVPNTDLARDALYRAAQSPPTDWEVDGTLARMRQAGVTEDQVAQLRAVYDEMWGIATAQGMKVGDLRGGYLPVRRTQRLKRGERPTRQATRASFQQQREVVEEFLGHEVPAVKAGLLAGTLRKNIDGSVSVVDPNKFNWTRLWKELDEIAADYYGDQFDPNFFEKDPFALSRLYINEWGARLENQLFRNAALEVGLFGSMDDIDKAVKAGSLIADTKFGDEMEGEVQRLIGVAEQSADATARAQRGEIAPELAEAADQRVGQQAQSLYVRLSKLVGDTGNAEAKDRIRRAMREVAKITNRVAHRTDTEAARQQARLLTTNPLDRLAEIADNPLIRGFEGTGESAALRANALRRWADRAAVETDNAQVLKLQTEQVVETAAEVGAVASSPVLEGSANGARGALRTYINTLNDDFIELGDQLRQAADEDSINEVADRLAAVLIHWTARANEFVRLRPWLKLAEPVANQAGRQWEDQLAAVEAFIHAEVEELARLRNEAVRRVNMEQFGDDTATAAGDVSVSPMTELVLDVKRYLTQSQEAHNRVIGLMRKVREGNTQGRQAADRIAEHAGVTGRYRDGKPFEPDVLVDPRQLQVDPSRFQLKTYVADDGRVADSIATNREAWNPVLANQTVVFEDASGVRYIVDGHQRRSLAIRLIDAGQRTGTDGQPIRLRSDIYKEADGWTPEAVELIASIKNIGEGSVMPIDWAQFIHRADDQTIELVRVSRGSTDKAHLAAMGLSKLDNEAFDLLRDAITNPMSSTRLQQAIVQGWFGRIGAEFPPGTHRSMVSGLVRKLPDSDDAAQAQIDELLRETQRTSGGAAARTTTETQMGFGEVDVFDAAGFDAVANKASVFGGVMSRVRTQKRGVSGAVGSADIIRQFEAGEIDPETIKQLSSALGQARILLERMYRNDPTFSNRLGEITAKHTKDGVLDKGAAVKEAHEEFIQWLQADYAQLDDAAKAELLTSGVRAKLADQAATADAANTGAVRPDPPVPDEPPPQLPEGMAPRPRATPSPEPDEAAGLPEGSMFDADDVAPTDSPAPSSVIDDADELQLTTMDVIMGEAVDATAKAQKAQSALDDLTEQLKDNLPPIKSVNRDLSPTEIADRIRRATRMRSTERANFERLVANDPLSATAYSNGAATAAFNMRHNTERIALATRKLEDPALRRTQRSALNAEIHARTEAQSNLELAMEQTARIADPEAAERARQTAVAQFNADTAVAEAIRQEAVPPTFNTEQVFETGAEAADAFAKDVKHIADAFKRAGAATPVARRLVDEGTAQLARFQDLMVPQEVADAFESLGKLQEIGKFGEYLTKTVSWWRGMALLSPRYHSRNFIGAVFSNWIAGVSVSDTKRIISEYRRIVKGLPAKDEPVRRYLDEMRQFGILGDVQAGADVGFFGTEIGTSAETSWNILDVRKQWKPVAYNRQLSSHIEVAVRGAAGWRAVQRLPKGSSAADRVATAGQLIDRLHFDYTDLSNFEQKIRNVIPFWTWASRNVPLQAMVFTHRPQAVLLAEKVFKNVGGGAPFNPFVPEYFAENRYTQLTQEWFATPELPYMSAIKDIGKLTENPLTAAVDLNPWFRSTLEFVTGRDAFRGYAIKGSDRWTRTIGDMIPPFAQLRRLAPHITGGTDSEESRIASSWMSFLGLPIRKVSDWERQAEYARLARPKPSAADAAQQEAAAEQARLTRLAEVEQRKLESQQTLSAFAG